MTSTGAVDTTEQAHGATTALVDELRRLLAVTSDPSLPHAVGEALAGALGAPDLLAGCDLTSDPRRYRQVVVHAEPDGSFSVVALVWLPGQMTAIHDHLAWCVVGVAQGAESEIGYRLVQTERGSHLVAVEERRNEQGSVQVLMPPGDIHRVHNAGPGVAVSVHIYGLDVTRVGSSIRRIYDGLEVVDQG